jgi:hypothetical protein
MAGAAVGELFWFLLFEEPEPPEWFRVGPYPSAAGHRCYLVLVEQAGDLREHPYHAYFTTVPGERQQHWAQVVEAGSNKPLFIKRAASRVAVEWEVMVELEQCGVVVYSCPGLHETA